MSKITWKGTTLLSPLPVIMATVGDMTNSNIITIAWTGIVNSQPPMTYISVRKERHSHHMIEENMQFAINLVPEELTAETDSIGVKSGAKIDKFKEYNLTKIKASKIDVPLIKECPVALECVVKQKIELGSHDMFLAEIVAVTLDDDLLDQNGKLFLERAGLVSYSHGEYFTQGEPIGSFGYSVKKPEKKPAKKSTKKFK